MVAGRAATVVPAPARVCRPSRFHLVACKNNRRLTKIRQNAGPISGPDSGPRFWGRLTQTHNRGSVLGPVFWAQKWDHVLDNFCCQGVRKPVRPPGPFFASSGSVGNGIELRCATTSKCGNHAFGSTLLCNMVGNTATDHSPPMHAQSDQCAPLPCRARGDCYVLSLVVIRFRFNALRRTALTAQQDKVEDKAH